MRPIYSSILAITAMLLLTAPALAESKASQCKQLRSADQNLQTQLRSMRRQTQGNALEKLERTLKVLENGTQQIRAMRLEDAKLDGFKQRVAGVYEQEHDALVDVYEAAAVRQDQAATKQAMQKYEATQKQERTALPTQLRQYCGFNVLETLH
jgi:hypothetical protein